MQSVERVSAHVGTFRPHLPRGYCGWRQPPQQGEDGLVVEELEEGALRDQRPIHLNRELHRQQWRHSIFAFWKLAPGTCSVACRQRRRGGRQQRVGRCPATPCFLKLEHGLCCVKWEDEVCIFLFPLILCRNAVVTKTQPSSKTARTHGHITRGHLEKHIIIFFIYHIIFLEVNLYLKTQKECSHTVSPTFKDNIYTKT